MRVYEAVDGPYLRWLADARRKMGDRAWALIEPMEGPQADAILAAKGVVGWKDSIEFQRAKAAESDDPRVRRLLGSLLSIARFVPVTYAEDAVVEIEQPDAPSTVYDPRVLTDRDSPSIDIDPMS